MESNFQFELENKDDFDWGLHHASPDKLSSKEAVKLRKRRIAWLRKHGKQERANLLAQCRRGNRCYLNDCPVCERRHVVIRHRLPKSVVREVARGTFGVRFCVITVKVDAIRIAGPRRPVNERKLRELKASILQIGLQTPITVRLSKNQQKAVLVAGLHRLIAMKQLGARYIPCFEHFHEESESYAWQRAENVYRAEPRVLDRAEYIDEMRQAILQEGGQVAPPGGRQPRDAGIKKAAKALGFTREDVRRCKAIAGISAEAKAEARKLGLDDNEHALFEIAKLPANAQRAAVKEIVDRQRAARARLASGAAVTSNKKAAAKIQAIEADIAKKKEAIESLKEKLSDDRDRLDKVQGKLVAACVNTAMMSGPSAQPADEGGIQAELDEPLSPEDEASFKALLAIWNSKRKLFANASAVVRERFIAKWRSCDAQESKKTKE
jgi:ParB-like chromosome segregation protein Spo0J